MVLLRWKFFDMEIEECEIYSNESGQLHASRVNEEGMKSRGESVQRLDNAFNPVEIWRKVFGNI